MAASFVWRFQMQLYEGEKKKDLKIVRSNYCNLGGTVDACEKSVTTRNNFIFGQHKIIDAWWRK
jgi:hypothetical protein